MIRFWFVALGLYLVLAVARAIAPSPPVVDLGPWHLLVIQSDDWGFEGWFPDLETAVDLDDLTAGLDVRLHAYKRSSLETGADVDSLAELLARFTDLDGLPPVLQANVIVAAIDVDSCSYEVILEPGTGLPLRQPGTCGPYLRPDRLAAEDRAIARGVWYPELHGLTHYNLEGLADAIAHGDPTVRRAAARGVVAFPRYMERTELEDEDPARAEEIAGLSVNLFEQRYGRPPRSVIAPDYHWGEEDERAWSAHGIEVVQAKRRQIDPHVNPTNYRGRALKVLSRWRDRWRNEMVYLERMAFLEPYGNPDPEIPQGAYDAVHRIESAWRRGEVACLETHRVQFSHFNPRVAAAGRAQLALVLETLDAGPGVRYCLDVEVAQLVRRGWSLLERGPWLIVRNYTDGPIHLDDPRFRGRSLAPGTHVLPQLQSEDLPAHDGYR